MANFKFPRAMGACADRLYDLKQKRLTLQREAKAIEEEEKALKAHIIDTLPKSKASGVAGKTARVTVVTKEVPQVDDQEKFRRYINRTKRFDLAQKLRPVAAAVDEMWEDGKTIPGVSKFNAVTVSLNKI